jgi:hypothetical protein
MNMLQAARLKVVLVEVFEGTIHVQLFLHSLEAVLEGDLYGGYQ